MDTPARLKERIDNALFERALTSRLAQQEGWERSCDPRTQIVWIEIHPSLRLSLSVSCGWVMVIFPRYGRRNFSVPHRDLDTTLQLLTNALYKRLPVLCEQIKKERGVACF